MLDLWARLFDRGAFMPHGHCYLWDAGLVRLHLLTDLAIGLAYVAISFTLAYLVGKAKREMPFSWMFVCFGVFIIACGATHFMEIWTLWTPLYWLSGTVKLVTAVASVATAIVLPPLVPKSLALIRSAGQLEQMNASLEQRVQARTADLSAANQALARLAAIVEQSNDAIISVDRDSRITTWNPAAERIYGFSRDEILGQSVSILAPASLSTQTLELVERLKQGERVSPVETVRIRRTGEPIEVLLTLSPIRDEAGEFQGASIIVGDITERKRAEEEIRSLNQELERRVIERTSELRAVNAELEAFSYSVSHDLRAPLRQIAGFSRIVVEDYGARLGPECQGYLNRLEDGAQQMGHLIDGLLNLSRVNQQMVSLRPVPLNPIIDSVLEVLKPECNGREIEWQIEKLGSLECDPMLLRQVFANLLSNSVKFTRNRTPAVIHIGSMIQKDDQVIFVRDNGSGFEMQYAGKLFGVFQRFHKSQDFEGTGVGLAIVHRIIHKHGGRIWAESEPNKGATFFFTIPPGPKRGEPRPHT